jgi:hypothetical protein
VASADGTRFQVRVMDGVKLVTIECEIDVSGNVQVGGGQQD